MKAKLKYDDSLDAFGVHGIGGIWGTIATGLFAEKAVNAAGAEYYRAQGMDDAAIQVELAKAAPGPLRPGR